MHTHPHGSSKLKTLYSTKTLFQLLYKIWYLCRAREVINQGFPTGGTRTPKGYAIEHQGVRRSLGYRAAYISLIEQYISHNFLGLLRMLWPDKRVRAAKKVGNPCDKRICWKLCSSTMLVVFLLFITALLIWSSTIVLHLQVMHAKKDGEACAQNMAKN